jgi:archaellum component FlaF (FlaF/FlaG flagellin family)
MNTNAPAVAIAPSLLQYSVRDVGATAQVKQAILRNMGTEPLLISKLTTSGDFSQTNTCGSSVAAGSTCNFTVTFSPTAPGSRFGTILIEDNAVGSPHFINLSGVGATPIVALNHTSLSFPSLQVNASSAVQTVALTNNGNATLNIASIAAGGDFAETNNCPASVALGAGCTVSLTFTPTAGGTRTGALTITDNAPGSPETVSLTGSGYVTTATLSASSLQFGSVEANATSAARTVTITNNGANAMVVTAVNVTGNFAQTNNCSTLAHAASCTLTVTFKPLSSGVREGTITLSDNAQGNPHQITLAGTGIAPGVTISPSSLTFGTQNAGISATKPLTITNSGNAALAFSSIQVLGDYAQTNNCSSVAPSATCTVTVTFDPTANGTRAGSIIFTDGAGNSPQTVALTGTGVAGLLTVSPSTLNFTSQPIGSASAAQTITLKNVGSAAMPISSIVALGSFTETNNCPASLVEEASCTVNVSFAPQKSGAASGAISLNGSTSAIPVSIAGMGSDFSLTPVSATSSPSPGSKATYTLNIASVGGAFSNAIALTCTGAPAGSTCNFSKQSVAPGSGIVPVTVTVTTESSANLVHPLKRGGNGSLALWILHANGLGVAFLMFGIRKGKAYRRMFFTLLLPFVLGTTLILGCGGGNKTPALNGGTPAGTYQLTVVGTSGSLQHFITLTMKVE